MTPTVFDDTQCGLGEGPLWHPKRKTFFWFDINGMRLYERTPGDIENRLVKQFDEFATAAGWVDHDTLVVFTETAILKMDIASAATEHLADLDLETPEARSNDGRADPWGGYWIGTMGKKREPGVGSIFRFYKGEIRKVVKDIDISNSICFSPDKTVAYYADTNENMIRRFALDPVDGWPIGNSEIHIDLRAEGLRPDGSVVDAEGYLWSAQYGAGRVVRYAPDGSEDRIIPMPAKQVTCPGFGGPELETLFVTTAAQNLDLTLAENDVAGKTFVIETGIKGQAEHRVIL